MTYAVASIAPKELEFRFYRRRCKGLPSVSVGLLYRVTIQNTLSVNPNDSTKIFNDWCAALCNTDTPPYPVANDTTLQQLCNQFANDYYAFINYKYSFVYNGVVAAQPDATKDMIEFCITSRDSYTVVNSEPYNAAPEELFHADSADRECTDANNTPNNYPTDKYPWREVYGPPAVCGGGNAKAHAEISDGKVSDIIVDDGGHGYQTDSQVVVLFEDGDGTGATATANINASGFIESIDVDDGGENYTVPPIVSFWSNTGPALQITRYKELIRGGKQLQLFVSVDNIGA